MPRSRSCPGPAPGDRRGAATVFARKIVILDEPTAALGVRESRVLDLIVQLRSEATP